MILNLTQKTKIRQLQECFSVSFPYLKLEFFDKPHGWGEKSSEAHCYDPSYRLSTVCTGYFEEGEIVAKPWAKAGEIESFLSERFGLYSQVYRRNGSGWIQTAGTDDLTLFEQNEIGKESVTEHHENLWIEREVIY